ncbi:hypothetical protein HYV89_05135 [Candidatus Woesearchaeota archaeon]|nr:hypothetical protein [Candidatus Woesearchaeota archaeon]
MNEQSQNPLLNALGLAVKYLKEDKAPTSMGYNDFALMFALAQEQLPRQPITSDYISKYLVKHPAIPNDVRLEPKSVEEYLELLQKRGLIEGNQEKGYIMHSEIVRILSANVDKIKTPTLEELAIRGISIYASWDNPVYRK